MKAQNLTISLPYKGCDKNCPYCISKMTGPIKTDRNLMVRNIPKVKTLATAANVTSVLLTSKGEPFLDFWEVVKFAVEFNEFPVEVQTNGLWLSKLPASEQSAKIGALSTAGVNTVAVSVDTLDEIEYFSELFFQLYDNNIVVRVCVNVTDKLTSSFTVIFDRTADTGCVRQLLVRNITVPKRHTETADALKAVEWINSNVDDRRFFDLKQGLCLDCIRTTPFGNRVYDLKGISVIFSDYCLQEANRTEDIRSLVFQEDGHVYTSWNSPASILF